ncbi:Smr/MutS family protein, partial [Acidisphaera rubrifaciens]|uniref:Smr/MutS family protein n=1 Tax=Acidisphaera rubrifaciens TaxID=50715 RepID=UPI0006622474
ARTLDLHGMTAAAAHGAVVAFILGAHAGGIRCVEIVTGRGSTTGAGTLRREFPHWLAASNLAGLVLAATHPGRNTGATRLLLRRARSETAGRREAGRR